MDRDASNVVTREFDRWKVPSYTTLGWLASSVRGWKSLMMSDGALR